MSWFRSRTGIVCSAHAEVIPGGHLGKPIPTRLLRTRGGDPNKRLRDLYTIMSAPHTRR